LNGHSLSWLLDWSIGLIGLFSIGEAAYLLEEIEHN
jgi:hypothetical protein